MYRLIEGTISNGFAGAGIVFFTKKGKVLILKKNRGPWGMPGGKPAYGELPEETAIRETFEETGIKIDKPLKPISVYYKHKKYYSYFYIFDEKVNVKLSSEHKEYKWVYFENLNKIKLVPPIRENLDAYLKEIKRLLY